jgi:hypothetical protein
MTDATLLLSHCVENPRYAIKAPSVCGKEFVYGVAYQTMMRPRYSVYHALNSGFENSEASPCPTDSFSDTDDDQVRYFFFASASA